MLEKIIETILALIAAIEQNTNALNGNTAAGDAPVAEKPKAAKPKAAKPKAAKAKAKGAKGKITVESVKAKAKKIAVGTDDAKACMQQIAELRNETAESCYDDANVGLDKFDETGLTLFSEALDTFVYGAAEPAGDDLEI